MSNSQRTRSDKEYVPEARQRLPNSALQISRRTTRGLALLTATEHVLHVWLYLLALVSKKYNLVLHTSVLMANHYHLVLTDVDGVIPKAMCWLNRQMSIRVKKLLKLNHEVFKANETYSCQRIVGLRGVLDSMRYAACNPVEAGIVDRANRFVGLHGWGLQDGEILTLTIPRPKGFNWLLYPKEVELTFYPPGEVPEEQRDECALALRQLIKKSTTAIKQNIKRFMGCEKFLLIDPLSVLGDQEAELPNCRLELKCSDPKLFAEESAKLKEWHQAYKEARDRFRAKDHAVCFPRGTWFMAQYCGANTG